MEFACLYDANGRVLATYPEQSSVASAPKTQPAYGCRFTDNGRVEIFRQVVDRGDEPSRKALESALARVSAAPDKLDRMKAVLNREAQMLSLLGKVQADTDEIIQRMKEEYKAGGNY